MWMHPLFARADLVGSVASTSQKEEKGGGRRTNETKNRNNPTPNNYYNHTQQQQQQQQQRQHQHKQTRDEMLLTRRHELIRIRPEDDRPSKLILSNTAINADTHDEQVTTAAPTVTIPHLTPNYSPTCDYNLSNHSTLAHSRTTPVQDFDPATSSPSSTSSCDFSFGSFSAALSSALAVEERFEEVRDSGSIPPVFLLDHHADGCVRRAPHRRRRTLSNQFPIGQSFARVVSGGSGRDESPHSMQTPSTPVLIAPPSVNNSTSAFPSLSLMTSPSHSSEIEAANPFNLTPHHATPHSHTMFSHPPDHSQNYPLTRSHSVLTGSDHTIAIASFVNSALTPSANCGMSMVSPPSSRPATSCGFYSPSPHSSRRPSVTELNPLLASAQLFSEESPSYNHYRRMWQALRAGMKTSQQDISRSLFFGNSMGIGSSGNNTCATSNSSEAIQHATHSPIATLASPAELPPSGHLLRRSSSSSPLLTPSRPPSSTSASSASFNFTPRSISLRSSPTAGSLTSLQEVGLPLLPPNPINTSSMAFMAPVKSEPLTSPTHHSPLRGPSLPPIYPFTPTAVQNNFTASLSSPPHRSLRPTLTILTSSAALSPCSSSASPFAVPSANEHLEGIDTSLSNNSSHAITQTSPQSPSTSLITPLTSTLISPMSARPSPFPLTLLYILIHGRGCPIQTITNPVATASTTRAPTPTLTISPSGLTLNMYASHFNSHSNLVTPTSSVAPSTTPNHSPPFRPKGPRRVSFSEESYDQE